jgi:Domain found in Dishevelled, Egl-10, and Pleckstrin (DEP)
MSQTTVPTALLCMPPGDARNAVRAAMMAMNVLPQDILPSRSELDKLAHTLHADSRAVAFIDLQGVQPAAPHLLALSALLPQRETRQRIALTRPQRGLWPSDRAWVQELGFASITAQLDSESLATERHSLLGWVAAQTGAASIHSSTLARYFSAMQVKPDATSPRGLIRKTTGLTAEALCAELASNVKALNRIYHLKSYPSCFIGTEAVAWLAKQYAVPKALAIQLGIALQSLGLLHHVAHEHAFADEAFFYRTAVSTDVERINLGTVLRLLRAQTGVEVRDRLYHGKTYPACFVGSEAVDWLHKTQKLNRHDAETLLNRLHGFNLIEHVAQEHPVRDGLFFYRFVA